MNEEDSRLDVQTTSTTEIKTVYTGEHVSMTILMEDGELMSISFRDISNGKHLFSLKYFRSWRREVLEELIKFASQAIVLLKSVGE